MNLNQRNLVILAASGCILSFTSCVSSKKFKTVSSELEAAKATVEQQSTQIASNSAEISQLKAENIKYGQEAEACRKAKELVARKYETLEKNLAEKGTSMKKIREKAQAAMDKFEAGGATVTYKSGLVHIVFKDDFFFKNNSSQIGIKGREALNTVAEVLRENPGVTAIILGHTDTLSIKGKADNWSLSTERANAVIRILHDIYNINPARLTAAGKSKYSPIADNSTEEGREQNRRVEIVLNPNLDRLWDLMEEQ
ncbi:MAG: hypothetical protein RL172_266 [Bacteroidota bacterium]|jgi:chemotaxis protein MotB